MNLRAGKRALVALASSLTLTVGTLGIMSAPAQAAEGVTTSRGVTIPAFYNPPANLPAKNGSVIRTESIKPFLTLPGVSALPNKAQRIMFKTTDAANKPAAVTGVYIEPTKKWSGKGSRPLVVVAPGTMGQGDQCATSLNVENPLIMDLSGGTLSVGYELITVYAMLNEGFGVMLTDYIGLGATDRPHTYMNRVDQGHTVNDAARAALSLSGTSLKSNSKVGFHGYSQGGGASAAAAELQPTYAPELNLVGAYAGAPPADLLKTVPGIDGSLLAVALGWTINGMMHYNPELTPTVDQYLNDKGKKVLNDALTSCVPDGSMSNPFTKTTQLTKAGISLEQVINQEPAIKAVVDAQRIGKIKPKVPVRVATGTADDTVPHKQSRQLAVDWCKAKANVTYTPVILPNLGNKTVLNHIPPMLVDLPAATSWMKDRFAGKKATSNCLVLPIMP